MVATVLNPPADGTCEHTLLDCLLSIHTCAAKEPVQLAQAELLALRYLGKKSPDHLPHLPPEIGSAVENALASNQGALGINVFDDLKNVCKVGELVRGC